MTTPTLHELYQLRISLVELAVSLNGCVPEQVKQRAAELYRGLHVRNPDYDTVNQFLTEHYGRYGR
jgi:hypothetical protein